MKLIYLLPPLDDLPEEAAALDPELDRELLPELELLLVLLEDSTLGVDVVVVERDESLVRLELDDARLLLEELLLLLEVDELGLE